jgi:GT2 family glycosyltransferase
MSEVAVIMVSWGRAQLLDKTLATYFQTFDPERASLTIVDNGSQKQTLDILFKYRGRIQQLILLNENLGKPAALNIGVGASLQECRKLGYQRPDYFLFCDSDLEFKLGWLPKMVTTYQEHRVLKDGKPLGGLSGYVHAPHQLTLHDGATTKINLLKYPAGCCLMMSREVLLRNGQWDTRRMIGTVDTSYLRNMHVRGYVNAAVYPDSVIVHCGKRDRTWHLATRKPKYRP